MKKEKSQRQLQAAEQIKRIIADYFSRQGLSIISGNFVTVTQADASPDLKNCKIFVDIIGDKTKSSEILKQLNKMAPNLRFELGKKLAMRSSPELRFVLDETSQYGLDIESLIDDEANKIGE